jgi:hypothetical protein
MLWWLYFKWFGGAGGGPPPFEVVGANPAGSVSRDSNAEHQDQRARRGWVP